MSISQNILDKNYLVVTNSIMSSLWVFLCAHNREAQQYLLEKIEKKNKFKFTKQDECIQ